MTAFAILCIWLLAGFIPLAIFIHRPTGIEERDTARDTSVLDTSRLQSSGRG